MNEYILNIISSISEVKKDKVYLDEADGKWHIDRENYFKWFDTKEEAEEDVEEIMRLDVLSKVANALGLDYGFYENILTISIRKAEEI